MNYYFVTDLHDKSFRGIQWGENVTNTEENPNYCFNVYTNPLIASFLYPAYEGFRKAKIWECIVEDKLKSDIICDGYGKLTTIRVIPSLEPTEEQHITFGILCALSVVKTPIFVEWGQNWIKGVDRTKETAKRIHDEISELLGCSDDYIYSAFPAIAAGYLEDTSFHSANAGYRSALDLQNQLNLSQVATIASSLSAEEIAQVL